jgi:hypothetical protein
MFQCHSVLIGNAVAESIKFERHREPGDSDVRLSYCFDDSGGEGELADVSDSKGVATPRDVKDAVLCRGKKDKQPPPRTTTPSSSFARRHLSFFPIHTLHLLDRDTAP